MGRRYRRKPSRKTQLRHRYNTCLEAYRGSPQKPCPGGRLVINAIRKEDIDKDQLLKIIYPVHLWHEKEIKSVANVSRQDVSEFLELAAAIPIRPEVQVFGLHEANEALLELKTSKIRGAKVLTI